MRTILTLILVGVTAVALAGNKAQVAERDAVRVDVPKGKPVTAVPARGKDKIGAFDKLWIRQFTVSMEKHLTVSVVPFDGTYTIAEVERLITATDASKDDTLGPPLASFIAAIKAASGQTGTLRMVTVLSRDSKAPVALTAVFDTADPKKPAVYGVRDIYDPAAPAAFRTAVEVIAAWVADQQK